MTMPFIKQIRGSRFLARLARERGLPARLANQAVEFDPITGRFGFVAELEERLAWTRHEQTEWLLEFIQCAPNDLPADDPERGVRSFRSFASGGRNIYSTNPKFRERRTFRPSGKELRKFRDEIRKAITRFVTEKKQWEVVPGPGFVRGLRWAGDRPEAYFLGGDWRTRFKLRAIELLEDQAANIRQCERSRCARLFLIHDRRQRFCSTECANEARLERFKGRMEPEEWREKRREYHEKARRKRRAT